MLFGFCVKGGEVGCSDRPLAPFPHLAFRPPHPLAHVSLPLSSSPSPPPCARTALEVTPARAALAERGVGRREAASDGARRRRVEVSMVQGREGAAEAGGKRAAPQKSNTRECFVRAPTQNTLVWCVALFCALPPPNKRNGSCARTGLAAARLCPQHTPATRPCASLPRAENTNAGAFFCVCACDCLPSSSPAPPTRPTLAGAPTARVWERGRGGGRVGTGSAD